ncbi:MAG: aminoglycoside phosphotransferase family protein [Solirubrobacterales bacterium]|nr:aminoglycoside phosphotransferase family protein [Solirubrobacterales bacterium]
MSEAIASSRWGPRERRQRACEAALGVGARLGLHTRRAVILRDWNNTIIRLAPAEIVAKVATSHFREARLESLDREVAVAAHLAARGAPVVPPTQGIPPGPHRWQNLELTLWQYIEPAPGSTPPAAQMAAALKIVHQALADFEGTLPAFTLELSDAKRLLQPHRSLALKPAERRFLSGVANEIQAALATVKRAWRPLHGSPHDANWLPSADGFLLLDFESACRGPVEWDLAALPDDALAFFSAADRGLITTMRRMRSVCVAAKCWVAPGRAPELREAAHVHLKLLRGQQLD